MNNEGYVGCMSANAIVEALGFALDHIERVAQEQVKLSNYQTASGLYNKAVQIENIRTQIVTTGSDVELYQRED